MSNLSLLEACKELCEAIRTMGELECYHALGMPDGEEVVDYIKTNWLDYVPQCKGDAYRKGMKAIAEAEENGPRD